MIELGNHAEEAATYGRDGRRHRQAVLNESIAMENWNALIGSVVAEHLSSLGVLYEGECSGLAAGRGPLLHRR